MSYKVTWFMLIAGAVSAALLHGSPDAPAICYGIIIGGTAALLTHWRTNLK